MDENEKKLFDAFGKPGEQFDDDWLESLNEAILEEENPVGVLSWNSGAPGAGAGANYVSIFRGRFIARNDEYTLGPFENFLDAAEAIGLLNLDGASTEGIWVDPKFRAEAENAIELSDDLSKEDALALFCDDLDDLSSEYSD